MFTRVFWSVAALALFALAIRTITEPTWHNIPVPSPLRGWVRWNEDVVKLEVAGLPRPPKGKVYQLWHIGPAAQPVGQGLFTIGVEGRINGSDVMKNPIRKGHKFALTLEPSGGSPQPTAPIDLIVEVP
jgi:hypothetical protein